MRLTEKHFMSFKHTISGEFILYATEDDSVHDIYLPIVQRLTCPYCGSGRSGVSTYELAGWNWSHYDCGSKIAEWRYYIDNNSMSIVGISLQTDGCKMLSKIENEPDVI